MSTFLQFPIATIQVTAPRSLLHAVVQPGHSTEGGASLSTWTLCSMRLSHGPDTLIGYESADKFTSRAAGACHRCQQRLEHVGMMMQAGKEGYR